MGSDTTPRTNWPSKSDGYKVVQLEFDGSPYLRFAQEKRETHAVISMNFFDGLDVEYRTVKGRSDANVPDLEGNGYRVHGMGRARVDVDKKRASFSGDSFDYGIGIDRRHLESMKTKEPQWTLEVGR